RHSPQRHAPAALSDGLRVVFAPHARRSRRDREVPPHGAGGLESHPRTHVDLPAVLSVGQVQDADPRQRSAVDLLPRQRRHEGSGAMKRFLKWTLATLLVLAVAGLLAFLYFIPPFFITPPEDFAKAFSNAAPTVDDITDPAERAIAARGRYIVVTAGCIGCHATNGPQGPDLTKYFAGGA